MNYLKIPGYRGFSHGIFLTRNGRQVSFVQDDLGTVVWRFMFPSYGLHITYPNGKCNRTANTAVDVVRQWCPDSVKLREDLCEEN